MITLDVLYKSRCLFIFENYIVGIILIFKLPILVKSEPKPNPSFS
jgi:hypothetical protein